MIWLLLSFVLTAAMAAAGVLPALNSTSVSATLTYDYIIVGCGITGLVVAMRMSELPVSVLCIEAGPL
jgi:ribulose 1,5-bisphosphate synthetase/thiazole synthase